MLEDLHNGSCASYAIRFAAGFPGVMMVLSGMSSLEQLQDNTAYMQDFRPLSEEEESLIEEAVSAINAEIEIPCTGCSYCTAGCPMDIPIPRYFSLYNTDKKEIRQDWTPQHEYYERLTTQHAKASDCIACGQCESICPQHLSVIDELKKVAEHFEPQK